MQIDTALTRRRIRQRLTNEVWTPNEPPSASDPVHLLGSLIRSLHAGFTLRQAIIECGARQMSGLARRMTVQLQQGRSLADVCEELSTSKVQRRRALSDDELLVIRVIGLAHTLGGDEAGLLDSVMQAILDRRRSRNERLTQAATAMSSMRLLTWLPVICGLWIATEDPTTRRFLVEAPGGRICLICGILLNLLGRIWSRRIMGTS
ncbi:MAG: type II secretion system F family protein [Ilumatobacteraceae bacterium]